MKQLRFIEGVLPKGFKPDFESFIFNAEPHRKLQSTAGWSSFSLVREDKKKILAAIHFVVHGKEASSPYKAPFGSVEFSKALQPKELYDFLREVEVRLTAAGVKRIEIKNPPEAYQPAFSSLLEVLLLNLGYRILQAEISTTIRVHESKYDQKIEGWELRKLRQGRKAKLVFREMGLNEIDKVYDFIRNCRLERAQSLSMSLAQLKQVTDVFPEQFNLFGVYTGKELAAASISIRVSKRILYNFYSAHPRKLDSLSPVVSLMQGIYDWSLKKHIELIDLGTSALEGQPNFSLLDFKLRLSGSPSTKFTFEKTIA